MSTSDDAAHEPSVAVSRRHLPFTVSAKGREVESALALARIGNELLQGCRVDGAGHELLSDHEGRRPANAKGARQRHVALDGLLQLWVFHVLFELGAVDADGAGDL